LNTEDVLTGAVDRPHGRLQYAVSGRNHGQAVLLLHPLGSDLAFWQPQLDDACAVLDELGVDRAHWCGLSLGGAVALQAALSVPARVQRLVLAHTAAAFPPRGLWDERISTVSMQGMAPLVEGLGARWFSSGFAIANPAAVLGAEATLREVQPRGYAECCAALRDFDVTAELGAVRAPTLVIGGAQDIATPPERAEALHDLIPGADLLMLDSGHLSNVEQAEEFSEAVSGFLRD